MEFKGTKGKWKYRPAVSKGCYYIETIDQSHNETFIGEVGGGLQSQEATKANARLIASSPELLEFARKVSELGYTFGDLPTKESEALYELHKEANKLIAKALGKEADNG